MLNWSQHSFFQKGFLFNFSEPHSTGVDFDELMGISFVAAFPHGQAVVHVSNNDTVVRMENFQIIRELYKNTVAGKAFSITGLHVQGSYFFVLHYNGTIVQMQLENGVILKIYNLGIGGVRNYGSTNTDICDINKEIVSYSLLPIHIIRYTVTI